MCIIWLSILIFVVSVFKFNLDWISASMNNCDNCSTSLKIMWNWESHHEHSNLSKRFSVVLKGTSIKYVTLVGVREGVTVCDREKGGQEHVTSHLEILSYTWASIPSEAMMHFPLFQISLLFSKIFPILPFTKKFDFHLPKFLMTF